jgi:ADP-ribose pyrophosphatase YjhB (NUDIX family)
MTGREVYRDSAGKRLVDYPQPSVAVDTALLTVRAEQGDAGTLCVLQVRREGGGAWGLPGTFLHPGERLADAVARSLRDKAGVTGRSPRQLRVFDDPARDDRGWVLSVAHVDVIRYAELAAAVESCAEVRIIETEFPGRLRHDHRQIIADAVDDLRDRYAREPDPAWLLPEAFTLRQLRQVHEAVAGGVLQRDTFRRSMEGGLIATGATTAGARGRPAELFRRRHREESG